MSLRIDGASVPESAFDSEALGPGAEAPKVEGRGSSSPESSAFTNVLNGLSQAVDKGEGLVGGVARGSYVGQDPGTLIALQAGIYRYSEVVDLAGKLVDRASSAVRSVLQSGH